MNGIPILDEIWKHGPLLAGLTMLFVDFGVISLMMWWEWNEFPFNGRRRWYYSFVVNDTIVYPVYVAVAADVLQTAVVPQWCASGFYHWSLFAIGAVISICVIWWEKRICADYHHRQWWKHYHTFIFVMVFYWLASSIVPVLVTAPLPERVIVLACVAACIANTMLDGKMPGTQGFRKYRFQLDWLIFKKDPPY